MLYLPLPFKRCGTCKRDLAYSRFGLNRSMADGWQRECKGCRKASGQKSYFKHHEEQRERSRRYSETHKEQIREKNKKWCRNNPEKNRAKSLRYYKRNHDKVNERTHERRRINPNYRDYYYR